MSTAEATISMVNTLTEPELRSVQNYIKGLIRRRQRNFKHYSQKELLTTVDESIKQSKEGNVYSWEDVRKEAREEYGF